MTISALFSLAASLCFVSATLWAGAMDLTTMKIRNELVLFLLGAYAAFAPLAGFGAVEIGLNAAAALAVLAGMFIFFGLGWIGGGDAKLAAVVVLWLGADRALPFALYMAVAGSVLTLLLLQFRAIALPAGFRRIPWVTQLHARNSGVPYGVAIAVAALLIFPGTPWLKALS
ncbi:prepilin peptidase [Microvirga sp. VF16]|uniref:A24 family peptidase n=1 Tax=Microvirga sp. VF16 TaxID=2807101 RepID=UPI00193D012C|nr:prepilin peptidase [Microvirga sp. VF16]QRM27643.1 prepilin peptidase [Microvirga sp. VF16]